MFDFNRLWGAISPALQKNAPAILTATGVIGLVSTSFVAVRNFRDAQGACAEYAEERDRYASELTLEEEIKASWKCYIPTATVVFSSAVAIVLSHRVHVARGAAAVVAFNLADRALSEYRNGAVSVFGDDADRKIRNQVASDRLAHHQTDTTVYLLGNGETLCYDMYTARYFKSDIETIRRAQNDVNEQIYKQNYVTLNEFYDLIGLPHSAVGDQVGFNTDRNLEIVFTSGLTDDGKPYLAIDFTNQPRHNYYI